MTENDYECFAALIADMLEFYGKTPSKFALNAWWLACRPYSVAEVSSVLEQHTTDTECGRFVPMPADALRRLMVLPRPKWATDAGFANRWEAENERCFAHNAHLFRDGKRITEVAQ